MALRWENGVLIDTENNLNTLAGYNQNSYTLDTPSVSTVDTSSIDKGLASSVIQSPVFKTGTNISTPENKVVVDPDTGGISGWTETLGNIGTGVQALSGLAGMYYADKNYKLQKDQADYLKSRDAASDTRMSKFASNAGNGASY